MKKGQVCEGIVERVDFPNKGIVRVEEGTVVVKNSLPGQKVKLGINKVRNGKAEGRLIEVVEKSPLETGETCSLFGVCGGCTYLSLPYDEQLRLKEAQAKRLLDSVLSKQDRSFIWDGIKGSPKAYEYRNKMEFSFGDEFKDGPLTLGLHKRGSFYDIVSVSDCKIVDGDYRLILKTVQEYFAARNISYYHRLRHDGYLRHLLVRKASGTGEILVALVTTSQSPCKSDPEAIQTDERGQDSKERPEIQWNTECDGVHEFGEEHKLIDGFRDKLMELENSGKLSGSFAGILHIINDSQADVVQSDRTDILYGKDYFYEELLGLKFKVSVFSFFQTNSYSAEVLYSTARDYVGDLGEKDKTVFDLYSGTGTIAQLMAPVAGKVVGVEIVEEAVEAAKQNAADNGLANCEFIAGDVLKVLAELEDKPDMIILDPPRDGIHPKALSRIINYGVSKIVYISCKPTSLVRDLEVFIQNGYQVERACAVDQFPWTANTEVVCLLSSRKPKPDTHVKLSPDMEEYYKIKYDENK